MKPRKKMPRPGRLLIALVFLCTLCGHKKPGEPAVTAAAVIFEKDGGRPAAGAVVKVFKAASLEDDPLAFQISDQNGRFSIEDLPEGIYCIVAEKDSFFLFQDSVIVAEGKTTLRDDTLECASSLTGTVDVKPDHDPRTVTIRIAGTGRALTVAERSGIFTFSGLAGGDYSLQITSTIPEYVPTTRRLAVTVCSHDTLRETLTLRSSGVPVVSGIRAFQDTGVGTIRLVWEQTAYRDRFDYLIYREHCEAKDFIHEPLRATRDTIFVDSLYASLSADLNDTLERCLRYWIAVRTNGREVGTAYQYTEWRLAPKSSIMTALSHGVRNPTRECDSASVNDTLLFSVKAWNRTRPLRSVVWFDPEKNDTISRRIIPDRLNREIKDTVRYSFDSLGLHRLVAIARDWAGIMRAETVSVKIVPDIPVADAGNDTGVFTGEKVRLHGRADQEFGSIAIWRWKIGEGEWQRTSSSDTVVTAPSTEQKIECLLEAVDEDGNRNGDRMTITTSYRVKAIAAGGFHSLILKEDGSCWTIGYNDHGQLGAGDNVWRASPVKILDSVQLMAAGDLHSLILKTDGTLWACGDNDSGRLGDGTTQWRTSPVKVCENVRSMAAGGKHSIILKTDNTLWTCGDNDSGQLGTGDTLRASRSTPVQVLSDVKAAAAGGRHSVAIKTDGTVWTCGKGRSGQLGTEVDSDKISFVKVMSDMQAVSAGDRHTLFLKNDGTLLTSGNNWYGQLGDNSGGRRLSPEIAMTGVRAVAAGTGFSLALKSDGTLWAFGTDSWGQLGIGAARDTVTMAVQMISDVQSIAAGERHSLILKTDGSLWGCGDNYCGQLGSAKEVRFDRPVMIIPRQ